MFGNIVKCLYDICLDTHDTYKINGLVTDLEDENGHNIEWIEAKSQNYPKNNIQCKFEGDTYIFDLSTNDEGITFNENKKLLQQICKDLIEAYKVTHNEIKIHGKDYEVWCNEISK